MFGLEKGCIDFLISDKEENLVKYEIKETKDEIVVKRKKIPKGSGICGNILIEKKKAMIVPCPSEDPRFNIKVDKNTTIPIVVFPILKFE